MAKSLKDILTGTKSSTKTKVDLKDWEKSKDGQKFATKHTIEKHADRAGNSDDVYKGKTKEAKYDRQKDGVYEEVEELDEISKIKAQNYIDAAKVDRDENNKHISDALFKKKHPEEKKDPGAVIKDVKLGLDLVANRSKGIRTAEAKLKGKAVVPANEELEQIDEISDKLAWSYTNKNLKEPTADPTTDAGFRKNQNRDKGLKLALDKQSYPKTSLNKAKVPTSDATTKEKKYQDAIKEEEQLAEISDKLALGYVNANLFDRRYHAGKEPTADVTTDAGFRKNQNRDKGLKLALAKTNPPHKRMQTVKVPTSDATTKEKKYQDAIKEEEQLDELSDKLKANYREKATTDIKNKFDSAMDSERMGDSKTTNNLLKKVASRKVNIKKSMNESMKCESCGAMYEGESCGCGGKKKLLLGGKKSLKEVLSRFNEGKKVDDMVKHVKSSEKKAGHSDKEAENIAWATANKRGMLDNKNKKMEEEAAVEPMLEGGKKKVKK